MTSTKQVSPGRGNYRGPATPELVRSALACVPPDIERDTWVRIAMAVKSELGDGGFDEWDQWSQRGEAYSATDARDVWKGIKAGGKVTVATLFGIAKHHGFIFPSDGPGAQPAPPDPAAKAEQERVATARAQERAAEVATYQRRADEAAHVAAGMWSGASQTGESPYLVRKGVRGHGVRFLADGTLLVPVRDATGEVLNLQRIAPQRPADGSSDKRFLPGGRKTGLWHMIGCATDAPVILLAEGYATAATLHEATSRPVAMAFDAGNLANVARELRKLFPAALLMVCGDDDHETEDRTGKNPGRLGAAAAARAVHAEGAPAGAVFPEGLNAEGTDFNDLAAIAGLDVVREIVERALLAPEVPKPRRGLKPAAGAANVDGAKGNARGGRRSHRSTTGAEGAAAADRSLDATPGQGADGSGGRIDAPASRRGRDAFTVDEAGVWFIARDQEGNPKPPMWLSDPVHVTANTRDEIDNGHGYLIEFVNRAGNPRSWPAPSALFSGDASEWAARLRDMGLRMATGARARNLLGQYIDSRDPGEWVTCTDRVGWHGSMSSSVYVLPSRSIGNADGRRFVFQSESGLEDTFRQRGELAAWRRNVAGLCVGNSRLLFAVSAALAGALVGPLSTQTGGFHLVGDSSLGKTTALLLAASVWGPPKFKQQWRSTDNGLESTAVQHSDCLLILDEISQMDGRLVGDCAYMLANEAEKIRGSRGMLARKRRTWRLLFLSSGEKSLADHMQEAGKKPNEGQLVRMPSVPADAGAGLGMFEHLHDQHDGKAFAESITRGAATTYGTAGVAWIEWLAENMTDVPDLGATMMDRMVAEWVPANSHPQVARVATRFALVGAAGELATRAEVTGWEAGDAEQAARACFLAWLKERGHAGNGEEAAMLRQVRAFLEKNGELMFSWTHRGTDDHKPNTPMRAGFRRMVDDDGKALKIDAATEYVDRRSAPELATHQNALVEYLVLPEAFRREICKGFTPDAVAGVLAKRGHLKHDAGRLQTKQRLPGMGATWCFHIKHSIFSDEL